MDAWETYTNTISKGINNLVSTLNALNIFKYKIPFKEFFDSFDEATKDIQNAVKTLRSIYKQ